MKLKKRKSIKNKIINTFMISGKKEIGEKILFKFAKNLQKFKTNKKKFIIILQLVIINTTPTFSINEQIVKQGKKKIIKTVPFFLSNHSNRINNSLNIIKKLVISDKKESYFYKMFAKEVFNSFLLNNSHSIIKKTDLQKQVLLSKRYWSSFKW